jgi:hypothetical protein
MSEAHEEIIFYLYGRLVQFAFERFLEEGGATVSRVVTKARSSKQTNPAIKNWASWPGSIS